MPNLTAQIPHRLTRAEAKRRLQSHIAVLRQQGGAIADLHESWNEDLMTFSLRTMGQTITGQLKIADDFVYLDIAFPWLLSLVANAAKANLEQNVRNILTDQTGANTPNKK